MSYGTGSHYLTLSNGESVHCVVSHAGLGRFMATEFDGDAHRPVCTSASRADALAALRDVLEVELESDAGRVRDRQFAQIVARTR